MKKSILMLGLAVAAMSSCTNDEVIDMNQSNQKAIGFESSVNKGTRAVDEEDYVPVTNEVTSSNLNRFYVYGNDGETDIFNNVSVIKSSTKWVMQDEKNWETKEYKFAAYADGVGEAKHEASEISPDFEDGVLIFEDYIISGIQNAQTDLIAATYSRDNTNYFDVSVVSLNFKHLLSKVDFKFTNTNENNFSMVVSNVTLKVKTKADCAYNGTAIWSDWDTETTYSLTQPTNGTEDASPFGGGKDLNDTPKNNIIAKGNSSKISAEYFVIPGQTVASINYTVKFYDAEGNEVDKKENQTLSLFRNSTNGTVTWTPSFIYKYDVQLPASPKKIAFTVGNVGGWKPEGVYLDGKMATTAN